MTHRSTGKGPTYGEFSFPSSGTTWVKGYARGGRVSATNTVVQKPAPTMKARSAKPQESSCMKVGGMVGKMASLKPSASVQSTPKKMNVKSRLSAGTTATEMKKGGEVHSDIVKDKAIVKKAIRMHDDQLHGGKATHLKTLRRGGKTS